MLEKFNKFDPQLVVVEHDGSAVVLTNNAKLSLYKKSQNSGISVDILEEVYQRGHRIWNEKFGGTADSFAFDRVNSFIAGGLAQKLDEDLIEVMLALVDEALGNVTEVNVGATLSALVDIYIF